MAGLSKGVFLDASGSGPSSGLTAAQARTIAAEVALQHTGPISTTLSGFTSQANSDLATLAGQIATLQTERGQPSGVATLDAGGLLSPDQLPALALSDTFVVASEAAMLALAATAGDVAIRTDTNESYILAELPAATLVNWKLLLTPESPVQTVAGRTGEVVLVIGDISGLQAALDAAEPALPASSDGDLYLGGDRQWHAIPAAAVSSVNGLTGVVVLPDPPVLTVNGQEGDVTLDATDVGAEPTQAGGSTAQYWRGDKSWHTLNTGAVPEGSNLYFTTGRAAAAAPVQSVNGATGAVSFPQTHLRTGTADIPLLTAGGSSNLSVTWDEGDFPEIVDKTADDIVTAISVENISAGVLGSLNWQVTAKTLSGCTVQLKNTGLVSVAAAGNIRVLALLAGVSA